MNVIRSLIIVLLTTGIVPANTAESKKGMVVTVHPLATDAGVRAMKEGGNAIDAAVAAGLMLGVVDGHNSGIGGGCFMLIRTAGGKTFALDGREIAPAAATRDMFVRDGKGDTKLSQNGPLASGIPGSVAVYEYAAKSFGRRPVGDSYRHAADVAEKGFPLDRRYVAKLRESQKVLMQYPETARILLAREGELPELGATLVQGDLARTYRGIAEQGSDYFYRGEFAKAVGEWMKNNGGIITAEDFANYEMKQREPLVTKYRGRTIVGFPPPSSGGVHVAQVFNILESFDLAALKKKSDADRVHVTAEAMKLAFADRAHWLGDPDFVPVPRGLADPAYAKMLAAKIDLTKALNDVEHGTPPEAESNTFGKHTTHIATADAEGNVVALTQTVNTGFGSKVIVPGTGVILNNQMDDFSIQPGVPNSFKLLGSDANAVAPKKRPLSSMSPTIVMDEAGKPVMTLGAAGGPTIITQVICVMTAHFDLGDDLPAAMARPRFHHQWSPATLRVEKKFDEQTLNGLKDRGHEVAPSGGGGVTNAIVIRPDGTFIGVSEPRVDGKSAGPE